MQTTEILPKKQTDKLDEFVNYIHSNIQPTLVDDAIAYILRELMEKKSKEDRMPSGTFYLKWTSEHLEILKEQYAI